MNLEILLKELMKIREQKSYYSLAKDLSVSEITVYRWLNGLTVPSPLDVMKISDYVNRHHQDVVDQAAEFERQKGEDKES